MAVKLVRAEAELWLGLPSDHRKPLLNHHCRFRGPYQNCVARGSGCREKPALPGPARTSVMAAIVPRDAGRSCNWAVAPGAAVRTSNCCASRCWAGSTSSGNPWRAVFPVRGLTPERSPVDGAPAKAEAIPGVNEHVAPSLPPTLSVASPATPATAGPTGPTPMHLTRPRTRRVREGEGIRPVADQYGRTHAEGRGGPAGCVRPRGREGESPGRTPAPGSRQAPFVRGGRRDPGRAACVVAEEERLAPGGCAAGRGGRERSDLLVVPYDGPV